jgi:hypothetical protein
MLNKFVGGAMDGLAVVCSVGCECVSVSVGLVRPGGGGIAVFRKGSRLSFLSTEASMSICMSVEPLY